MAQRKQLTTRPLEQETLLVSVNRELIPYLREQGSLLAKLAPSTPPGLSGSRGGATVAVLTELIAICEKAGILTDNTTP
jgi:hypothetical protein